MLWFRFDGRKTGKRKRGRLSEEEKIKRLIIFKKKELGTMQGRSQSIPSCCLPLFLANTNAWGCPPLHSAVISVKSIKHRKCLGHANYLDGCLKKNLVSFVIAFSSAELHQVVVRSVVLGKG